MKTMTTATMTTSTMTSRLTSSSTGWARRVSLLAALVVGVGIGVASWLIALELDTGDHDGDCRSCMLPTSCVWANHHAAVILAGLFVAVGILWIVSGQRRRGKACRGA